MEGNGCQFGESCSFAHGHGEVKHFQHFPPNNKYFAGTQRADEPGSAEPKLQRVPVQVLHDHGGV